MAKVTCPKKVYRVRNRGYNRVFHMVARILDSDSGIRTACGVNLLFSQGDGFDEMEIERVPVKDLCANCFRGFLVEESPETDTEKGA